MSPPGTTTAATTNRKDNNDDSASPPPGTSTAAHVDAAVPTTATMTVPATASSTTGPVRSTTTTTTKAAAATTTTTTTTAATTTTQSAAEQEDPTDTKKKKQQQQRHKQLDFIGTSHAVKDLFSVPYALDRPISVAVHNLGGTLVLDCDRQQQQGQQQRQQQQRNATATSALDDEEEELKPTGGAGTGATNSRRRRRPSQSLPSREAEVGEEKSKERGADGSASFAAGAVDHDGGSATSTSLVALSSLELDSEALSIVNSVIESSRNDRDAAADADAASTNRRRHRALLPSSRARDGQVAVLSSQREEEKEKEEKVGSCMLPVPGRQLPPPEEYAHRFIPPSPEPREYLSWQFSDLNLLVGSDALIYRSPPPVPAATTEQQPPTSPVAAPAPAPVPFMAVRVEEVREMKALLRRHEESVRRGEFVPDHRYGPLQQLGKPSYAEAIRRTLPQLEDGPKHRDDDDGNGVSTRGSFAAPDLDQVRLQTCVVPATNAPLGGLLSSSSPSSSSSEALTGGTSPARSSLQQQPSDDLETSLQEHQQDQQEQLSPVSTVLSVYLDNIMANVPQLALCLQDKGFIQSVKLLQTDEIPAGFMNPSTFDTTSPFDVIGSNPQAEKIFSPQIMETNASTLLRFLKSNCSRDNATYLLRREAGQTNIQLYDISTISTQRQHQWTWWLAMMSYRFANRLKHLSQSVPNNDDNSVLLRTCRARQRSLLQNTLDLLEILSDLDGNKREILVAAVGENLADTFLGFESETSCSSESAPKAPHQPTSEPHRQSPDTPPPTATSVSTQQPYGNVTSVDALTKAQDHLLGGIKALRPVLRQLAKDSKSRSDEVSCDSDKDDEVGLYSRIMSNSSLQRRIEPIVTQLLGLNIKFVNVSLRLAEIHLRNYYSSSAMQTLRASARGIADSLYFAQLVEGDSITDWLSGIQLQYTWLWEHCGHFARSFAADDLWRDRGHASGDDVVSVLVDAENAIFLRKGLDFENSVLNCRFVCPENASLSVISNHMVDLHSLSGVVAFHPPYGKKHAGLATPLSNDGLEAAKRVLLEQRLILREKRKVLVAASIAYCRAIQSYRQMNASGDDFDEEMVRDSMLLMLLQQRLGDACNETGKLILNELRNLLTPGANNNRGETHASVAAALLSSSRFWFFQGLGSFAECNDTRNLALLCCNLCQSYKLQANSVFETEALKSGGGPTHAELCLEEAVTHLQAAHESLGERDVDPLTWDMVSEELAATYLVLGVRRRQSLIGSGNLPLIMQALRLSPGKEHSIIDPMERALGIYEQLGNWHQAAAAHYQLALYFSKVCLGISFELNDVAAFSSLLNHYCFDLFQIWTCQLNEAKTREKLSSAFRHFNAAHSFFSQCVRGNEVTFCVLCNDLSNLYATVSGEEGTRAALLCCLDTAAAVSKETIDSVLSRAQRDQWFDQMATLATTIEDRIFKLLRSLTSLEGERKSVYKDLYRSGLSAKMSAAPETIESGDENIDKTIKQLLTLHSILQHVSTQLDRIPKAIPS